MSSIYVTNTGSPFGSIFGPISKDYCFLFYFAEVISFVVAMLNLMMCAAIFFGGKKYGSFPWFFYFSNFVMYFVNYIGFRLLYTMCIS